jgi:hypothetical protein
VFIASGIGVEAQAKNGHEWGTSRFAPPIQTIVPGPDGLRRPSPGARRRPERLSLHGCASAGCDARVVIAGAVG